MSANFLANEGFILERGKRTSFIGCGTYSKGCFQW